MHFYHGPTTIKADNLNLYSFWKMKSTKDLSYCVIVGIKNDNTYTILLKSELFSP